MLVYLYVLSFGESTRLYDLTDYESTIAITVKNCDKKVKPQKCWRIFFGIMKFPCATSTAAVYTMKNSSLWHEPFRLLITFATCVLYILRQKKTSLKYLPHYIMSTIIVKCQAIESDIEFDKVAGNKMFSTFRCFFLSNTSPFACDHLSPIRDILPLCFELCIVPWYICTIPSMTGVFFRIFHSCIAFETEMEKRWEKNIVPKFSLFLSK